MNTLVRAVPARDVAQVAADALFRVDARDDFVIQVEMLPILHAREAERRENRRWSRNPFRPSSFSNRRSCPRRCEIPSASARCRAARSGAQQNKFGRVAPAGNAADAGNRQPDSGSRRSAGPCAARSVSPRDRNSRHARKRRRRWDAEPSVSRSMPVMELMVLMAESPSAPPCFAARAMRRMSVTLGVSFTSTGVRATSFTHSVIIEQYSGTWPTALPMPRSLMPCGQPKFSSSPSAPASSDASRSRAMLRACDSTISDAITA